MTLRLVLSPKASRDVVDIWDYSARTWSVAQADRYINRLRDLLKLHYDPIYRQSIKRNFKKFDASKAIAPQDRSVRAMTELARAMTLNEASYGA